jgi:hypothetical protein
MTTAAVPADEASDLLAVRDAISGKIGCLEDIVRQWPTVAGATVMLVIQEPHGRQAELPLMFPDLSAASTADLGDSVATIIADRRHGARCWLAEPTSFPS